MKWVIISAVVVVGAVVVIVIVATSGDKAPDSVAAPSPAASPPPATAPTTNTTTPVVVNGYLGADESMKRFFDAIPTTSAQAVATSPATLVGKWHATIVALPIPADEPAIDPAASPGFDFEIVTQAGQLVLRSADGKGQSRQLVTDDHGLVAKAEGGSDLRITLRDQTLVGEMPVGPTGAAAQGRMVFHASRIK